MAAVAAVSPIAIVRDEMVATPLQFLCATPAVMVLASSGLEELRKNLREECAASTQL